MKAGLVVKWDSTYELRMNSLSTTIKEIEIKNIMNINFLITKRASFCPSFST